MDEKIVSHLDKLNRELENLEKTDIYGGYNQHLAFRMQPDVTKESITAS